MRRINEYFSAGQCRALLIQGTSLFAIITTVACLILNQDIFSHELLTYTVMLPCSFVISLIFQLPSSKRKSHRFRVRRDILSRRETELRSTFRTLPWATGVPRGQRIGNVRFDDDALLDEIFTIEFINHQQGKILFIQKKKWLGGLHLSLLEFSFCPKGSLKLKRAVGSKKYLLNQGNQNYSLYDPMSRGAKMILLEDLDHWPTDPTQDKFILSEIYNQEKIIRFVIFHKLGTYQMEPLPQFSSEEFTLKVINMLLKYSGVRSRSDNKCCFFPETIFYTLDPAVICVRGRDLSTNKRLWYVSSIIFDAEWYDTARPANKKLFSSLSQRTDSDLIYSGIKADGEKIVSINDVVPQTFSIEEMRGRLAQFMSSHNSLLLQDLHQIIAEFVY